MYYRLKPEYKLRGWDRLPFALYDSKKVWVHFFMEPEFNALSLCTGDQDIDSASSETKECIAKLLKQGFIEECAKGESIADDQHYFFYNSRFMRRVSWSITGRCNCKCRHCYLSAGDGRYGELSREEIFSIIDGLAECGVYRCSLTGGEPLIRKDFLEIVDRLTEKGIFLEQLYSNGLLFNEALVNALEERGLRPEIHFSFDGIGFHDWIRGVDGAEEKVRRALTLCRERGFQTGVQMTIFKDNVHVLRDSINYLASVGVQSIKLGPISDTGAWREGGYQKDHGLTREETYRIVYEYLEDFYKELPHTYVQMAGYFSADGRKPDEYSIPVVRVFKDPENSCLCGHARNAMYISPEGRAIPCMPIANMEEFAKEYPLIQETGVKSCLSDSLYMKLVTTKAKEVLSHNAKCRDCSWRRLCLGGCRAVGMECHPGDVLAPDESSCDFYEQGWLEKIESRIKELRPTAEFLERKALRELGREDELPELRTN